MLRRTILIGAAIILVSSLFAQGFDSYLPAKTAARAAKLLAAVDEATAAMEARSLAARLAQAEAEARAIANYALLCASRSSGYAWASPDGTLLSSGASEAFAAARAAARAAAKAASGLTAEAGAIAKSRAAAADSLASLVLASGIGPKSALGLEKYLAARGKELAKLFPEADDLVAQLLKAGAAGGREAAAAMAHREGEGIAASLIDSRGRVLELCPAAANALDRLDAGVKAYRSWIGASAIVAYPGDLPSASSEEREAFGSGLRALSALGLDRASSLLAAMAAGGPRDVAAAAAARRLAELWTLSPASRRRDIAALAGVEESVVAAFVLAIKPGAAAPLVAPNAPPASALQSGRAAPDGREAIAALNALIIAIADEESSASEAQAAGRGPEPALVLLVKPGLAEAARREGRYAELYAEASRRIGALYAQAAEGAQARLESSAAVFDAAARALGSSPTGLVVRAVDLAPTQGGLGRRLAFVANATDAAGGAISLPLRAELAGREYATAFSRAAGLPAAKSGGSSLLSGYGQLVISAYDPDGWRDTLAEESFPSVNGSVTLGPRAGAIALELALLRGWRP